MQELDHYVTTNQATSGQAEKDQTYDNVEFKYRLRSAKWEFDKCKDVHQAARNRLHSRRGWAYASQAVSASTAAMTAMTTVLGMHWAHKRMNGPWGYLLLGMSMVQGPVWVHSFAVQPLWDYGKNVHAHCQSAHATLDKAQSTLDFIENRMSLEFGPNWDNVSQSIDYLSPKQRTRQELSRQGDSMHDIHQQAKLISDHLCP